MLQLIRFIVGKQPKGLEAKLLLNLGNCGQMAKDD